MLNLIIASIVGLVCGVGVVLSIEYIDNTVKSPLDIETHFGLPVLGLLPFVENDSGPIGALGDQRSHISEAFQSLKTALQFSTPSGLPKTLAITSARPGEGKSTTSLALARSCAEQGIRVLLIDADLRKPSLHERLELSTSVGLSNYLAGTMQASEVVQRTDLDRLFFIASGPLPPNPADLFAGPKFSSLLTLGGEFFDIIIVDAPPVLALADAPLIANAVSETIFVVSARQTRREIIRVALKRLNMARAHVLGVVLNRFRFEHSGYGEGYGYDYYGYGDASGGSEPPLELPKKTRPAVVES
jgi:capsular exopolysaccharide synthesis family protein